MENFCNIFAMPCNTLFFRPPKFFSYFIFFLLVSSVLMIILQLYHFLNAQKTSFQLIYSFVYFRFKLSIYLQAEIWRIFRNILVMSWKTLDFRPQNPKTQNVYLSIYVQFVSNNQDDNMVVWRPLLRSQRAANTKATRLH